MQYVLNLFRQTLNGVQPPSEARELALWTLEELTGMSRTELLLHKDSVFPSEIHQKASLAASRIASGEPIQYVFGYTMFMGLRIDVDRSVLIPRPETAELVSLVLTENTSGRLTCIDLATGSGCIALALKHRQPSWDIRAFDLLPEPIEMARHNASRLNLHVDLYVHDMFQPFDFQEADIIVSNPPYIPQSEAAQMEPNVLQHEPHTALFVPDDDPLICYRALAQRAKESLKPGGRIYMETHCRLAHDVAGMMTGQGLRNVRVCRDLSGNDRIVRAEK
ncbi:MAG: peptide chain release factor N(5)-glutamine methyltransferase [Paludibacteraceae bacterium]|nr:peptide chain release factor N(5)-glutamine methyltransferase [Paludibacteraceae bacterium]